MTLRTLLSRLTLAGALACGVLAAQAQDTIRPELVKPLQAAQDLLKAGEAQQAMAQLALVEAASGRNELENYYLARLKASAAVALNQPELALGAYKAALASPQLDPKDRPAVLEASVAVAYRVPNLAEAERLARLYLNEGGQAEGVRTVLVHCLNTRGDYAGLLPEVQALIRADEAAGRPVSEVRLQLQGLAQSKLGDGPGYRVTLERLVAQYPKTSYWADLLGQVQRQPGFAPRLSLDLLRLARQVGTLTEAGEYVDMAELALLAGQPGEALAVVSEGFERKLLGQGADAASHDKLRQRAQLAATKDKAQLTPAVLADAAKAKDGRLQLALGQALIGQGDPGAGLALMKQGLDRGVAKQADDARLHYGAALVQAGQREQALAVLKTVQGEDGTADLARLWTWVRP
jgi:hypothetical protein